VSDEAGLALATRSGPSVGRGRETDAPTVVGSRATRDSGRATGVGERSALEGEAATLDGDAAMPEGDA
jgi:hypothetical protein